MLMEDTNRAQHKWACVQFIAEVSLIANCKPSDLKLALSLIADLAHSENSKSGESVFYEVE
ncbi:MAG TPA: hypothetical protein VJY31_08905 [Buttiauxella sp.]|nr:hypothetical protein [Buttiauxella sp.]